MENFDGSLAKREICQNFPPSKFPAIRYIHIHRQEDQKYSFNFGQIFEWHSGGQEAIAYTGNEINNITGTDKHLYECIYNQTDDESFNLCDASNLPIVKFNDTVMYRSAVFLSALQFCSY